MNQEILNRLAIDRAAKALTDDVAALVDAYLEREPEQAALAMEIDQTVQLARLALPRPTASPLPRLKLSAFPAQDNFRGTTWRRWWPAEIAAALVVGIGLGIWAFRPPERAVEKPLSMAAYLQPAPQAAPEFWSTRHLANIGWKSGSTQSPRLTWNSALQNVN